MLCFLYVTIFDTGCSADFVISAKSGLFAVIMVNMVTGLLIFSDGPFIRPHPAFWRLVLSASVIYLSFLVFLLFQSLGKAREIVALYDPALNVPLPERSYAKVCEFTISNIFGSLDIFVLCHILGWFCKSLIIRDEFICWILSIGFELLEYSLTFQLPNFAECWWDHWILDVLLCNSFGIILGRFAMIYFRMKSYKWGLHRENKEDWEMSPVIKIPFWKTISECFFRRSWFRWNDKFTFKDYFVTFIIVLSFLVAELNAFYLKNLLWIPIVHPLNIIRLCLIALMGAGSVREVNDYFYYDGKMHQKFGVQAWVTLACVFTEAMICIKFGRDEFTKRMPNVVFYSWIVFGIMLSLYTFVRFCIISKWLKKKKVS